MTKNNRNIIFSILFVITTIGFCFFELLYFDTTLATRQSLESRITWLEDKMIERIKPVIQINRATIYNTEGEIVIETLDKK